MNYRVVEEPEEGFLVQATQLHHEALSYRSFITLFGVQFLTLLYREFLASRLGFLVVAHEEERLGGFILASTDSSPMMSVVWRRPHLFVPVVAPILCQHPRLVLKILETLFYSRRENSDVCAELVVIAVRPELRSQGVGRKLVERLDSEFCKRGVSRYKVTVHSEMDDSNRFYGQNGFHLEGDFRMYGVPWNLYLRDIPAEGSPS